MCGIAGIIDKKGIGTSGLVKMSELLRHRGPDDEGFTLIDAGKKFISCKGDASIPEVNHLAAISTVPGNHTLGFLHRRLSILDLSPAAHQPMSYNDHLLITYNGEIYNYREIRAELVSKGHTFRCDSDTEVILASYKEWGTKCVGKFIGMWAFAICDLANNQLFLSRDRFGIKPLYYFSRQGKFVFASEIKALLALPFVETKADTAAVLEYLSFGGTSNAFHCLFRDIEQVHPAQNMIVDLESLDIKTERYYDLDKKVKSAPIHASSALNDFKELLENSVDLHLRSDVPIGSCLSGGLDSSAIVSIAAKKISGNYKTFTAAYKSPEIDEAVYAKIVSDSFGNIENNLTWPDVETYWKDFEALTWHQDLPIHSASVYAQWEVMKLAGKANTKVVINGQGSDEILGGYYHFAGIHLIELLRRGKLLSFLHEFRGMKENFTPTPVKDMGRAFFYFLPSSAQRMIREEQRLGPNFISDKYRLSSDIPERAGRTFRESSIANIKYGLQELLRYEDRNSMAFSVESRVPFLDHRLVEYSIALDNKWKVRDGWSKYILRKAVESSLPKEVVWRKNKMGFVTPHGEWKLRLQKQLIEYVDSVQCPELINKPYLRKLCSEEITSANHLSEFWKIISFLKWTEIFRVKF